MYLYTCILNKISRERKCFFKLTNLQKLFEYIYWKNLDMRTHSLNLCSRISCTMYTIIVLITFLCLSYICLPSLNYICSERKSDGWVDFILGKKNVSFFLWYSIKIKLLKIFLKSMILWRNALWKMKIVLMHFPGEINSVTKFYVSLPTPDMLVCCVSKEGRWICRKFLFTRCGSSLWKILFWLIIQTFLTQITLK